MWDRRAHAFRHREQLLRPDGCELRYAGRLQSGFGTRLSCLFPLTIKPGQAFALSVSGNGWQSSDIGNLLTHNSGGFTLGSALGIDTSNGKFTYSGFGGGMGLTKLGQNTLTLTGNSTFMGNTLVSAGVLAVTTTGALPNYSGTNSSTIAVGNGATLALSTGTSSASWTPANINSFLANNCAGFTTGSALGLDTTSTATYGYSLAGSMGLTKLGNNTLTLTGQPRFRVRRP